MRISYLFMVLLGFLFCLSGCGSKIDPDAPEGMYLNGRERKAKLKAPKAFLQLVETGGYAEPTRLGMVIYEKNIPGGPMPQGGIELHFNLANVSAGEEVEIAEGKTPEWFSLVFHPSQGRNISEGKLLVFEARPGKGGSARVRFDTLEKKVGGRISGVILEATMDAYYDSQEGFREELSEPREMKLYNWSFDTTFQQHPFSGF